MRARHSRFNKIATTIVAGFAFVAATAGVTVLVLHNEGVINIDSETPNVYRARFYVDDAIVYEVKKIRGEEIGYGYEEMPVKDCDVDGQRYQFVGWDLTGEGIPDILPNRIYSNFNADAVFAKYGIPDIDWSKVDFNKLLDLLQYLNIDLESFMNFFGLDWEDMLDLLDIPIMNYTTDYSGLVYLRNESFGDYNPGKHKWTNASYYPLDYISPGSVNPLQFSIDKASAMLGEKANTVIELEYLKDGNNYPVMCYEKNNTQALNSDSISLTKPVDNKYTTTGLPYSYVTGSIITMLQNIPFSSDAIAKDELAYREYVRENYTAIKDEYKETILNICDEYGIQFDKNYKFVDAINNFFKTNYSFDFRMPSYPLTCDPPMYFLTDAKVGLGRHFAAATTLMYRALGVPARYVQGYVDYAETTGDNTIAAIQAHSWCEIYVDGVGWLATDTALLSVSPVDLGFLFSTDNIDELDFEAPPDGQAIDFEAYMKNDHFNVGDEIKEEDIICRATYDSGDEMRVTPTKVIYPDMSTGGDKVIRVFYNEGDNIFMEDIPIHVDGGVVTGTIQLISEKLLEVDYSGFPPYTNLSELFELIGADKLPMVLNDGDYAVMTPMFIGESKIYNSIAEIQNVGKYDFRVRVDIYNSRGENVTESQYKINNNYTDTNRKSKAYSLIIDAVTLRIGTDSAEIDEEALYGDPYYGIFYCPSMCVIYDDFITSYSSDVIYLENGIDFISVEEIPMEAWTTLEEAGVKRNEVDTYEIYVYRNVNGEYVDVTMNYEFDLDKKDCGFIAVNEVEG